MTRTKYQKFEATEINRVEIKNAPYNPRTISDKSKAILKKNLKKKGLLDTLVWNKRTGNLVSGHQRITILDELEGSQDYSLTVAVVDLDEKSEVEQNIFFNSTTPQGTFDLDALAELIDGGLDWAAAGLDQYDMNIIGVETDPISAAPDPKDDSDVDALNIAYMEKKEAVKAARSQSNDRIGERAEEGERYVSVSFTDYAAKAAFMNSFGLPPDNMFIQGVSFIGILNGKIEDGAKI